MRHFFPTEKSRRMAELVSQERKLRSDIATSNGDLDAVLQEHGKAVRDRAQLEAEPETFECPDCGETYECGEHVMVIVSGFIMPKSMHYEPIRLTEQIHIPYCVACCRKSVFNNYIERIWKILGIPLKWSGDTGQANHSDRED